MSKVLFAIENLCYLDNGPYSLTVEAHEIIGLSGSSGIGKTQMLRAMVECIPYSGRIVFAEQSPDFFLPSKWRRLVSLVPAESAWWHERVGEHFMATCADGELYKVLDDLGFAGDILSWSVDRLSTGERQRLALARALVLKPSILLLDEPCSALDRVSTERVERLLTAYRDNADTALIWVSHDDEQLRRVACCCYQVKRETLEPRWHH